MSQSNLQEPGRKEQQNFLGEALIDAAVYLDETEVHRLLTAGANPNFRQERHKKTALEFLVNSNAPSAHKVIAALMEHGADPNSVNPMNGFNRSAFMLACEEGVEQIILAMLEPSSPIKVDLLLVDSRQRTASMMVMDSVRSRFSCLVTGRMQAHFEENVLSKLKEKGHQGQLGRAHLWLCVDKVGKNTFMQSATNSAGPETMRWILEQNFVDPKKLIEATDLEGRTALWWSIFSDRKESVEFLLGHGAKIDVVDSNGLTLLQMAEGGTLIKSTSELKIKREILSLLHAVNASRLAIEAIGEILPSNARSKTLSQ